MGNTGMGVNTPPRFQNPFPIFLSSIFLSSVPRSCPSVSCDLSVKRNGCGYSLGQKESPQKGTEGTKELHHLTTDHPVQDSRRPEGPHGGPFLCLLCLFVAIPSTSMQSPCRSFPKPVARPVPTNRHPEAQKATVRGRRPSCLCRLMPGCGHLSLSPSKTEPAAPPHRIKAPLPPLSVSFCVFWDLTHPRQPWVPGPIRVHPRPSAVNPRLLRAGSPTPSPRPPAGSAGSLPLRFEWVNHSGTEAQRVLPPLCLRASVVQRNGGGNIAGLKKSPRRVDISAPICHQRDALWRGIRHTWRCMT